MSLYRPDFCCHVVRNNIFVSRLCRAPSLHSSFTFRSPFLSPPPSPFFLPSVPLSPLSRSCTLCRVGVQSSVTCEALR
ncbi:hypothetical protein FKM82_024259 [Ascaphus truei]